MQLKTPFPYRYLLTAGTLDVLWTGTINGVIIRTTSELRITDILDAVMSRSKNKTFKGQNLAEETSEFQNIRPTARNSISVNRIQLVSHCEGLGSTPGQSKWNMWLTKLHWYRSSLQVLWYSCQYNSNMCYNNSFIHHWRTYLVPKLKKEYNYTSTPPLCLHGMLQDDLYFYLITYSI